MLNKILTLTLVISSWCCPSVCAQIPQAGGPAPIVNVSTMYTKSEHRVRMRDGVTLHTVVYAPKNQSEKWPIVINRSPYSCRPYGARSASRVGPSKFMEKEGYIFVKQDVRGRWNSEGKYDNMRPHVPGNSGIDESSDTWDTIDWLLKNVPNNNGKVGIWGISYPGFYAAAALPEAHPALVASSPQAPISDFFFDDFHHHGAYLQSYWLATSVFGYQHNGPTTQSWYKMVRPKTQDGYKFYMDLGPLSNSSQYYSGDNFFWQQLVEHPNYDEFWQKRSILPHLHDVRTNVLTVGGLFDAEDLYGPLNIYKTLEKNSEGNFNGLVMGPWSHGGWSSTGKNQMVGNIFFGEYISTAYQRDIEAPFFRHFLKGKGDRPNYEAMIFDTGRKQWRAFQSWPPSDAETVRYYLHAGEVLSRQKPDASQDGVTTFLSDPNEPVPYTEDVKIVFTPRKYMSDDQRFAERRPDVIEFQTEVLSEPVTLAGEILADLRVATDQTAADWIVKLIDVYPDDEPNVRQTPSGVKLGGYQQMVRSEVIRGRFRNSYEKPEPFVSNQTTTVQLPLQDVFHTFKPGHRIMVQIQSTWFPLIDRNPQKYVDNIFKAKKSDFVKATHSVFHSPEHPTAIRVQVIAP